MRSVSLATLAFACEFAAYGQVLKTVDISPDQSDFVFSGEITPGGRVKSMVIDPNHDNILYAATEFAGVWKTTTAFRSQADVNNRGTVPLKWFQSSNGLRNGLTVNQYSLAVDAANSARLLYASGDNDGRPLNSEGVHPYGGLWISTDSAGHWSHVKLCKAPLEDAISAVVFSTGRPFVATSCGVWTNSTATLDAKSWTALASVPFGSGVILADGGYQTLLACLGKTVYRSANLGGKWAGLTIASGCEAVTAVPNGSSPSYQAAVVRGVTKAREVTIVDFNASTTSDLGFAAVSSDGGSGVSAVATVQNPALPLLIPIPGDTYDLYAADGFHWFEYTPSKPHFIEMPSNVHVDTWAMAIPSWYYPTKGLCAGYVANDGGVFFGLGNPGSNLLGGGCAKKDWTAVVNGLHAMEGTTMTGISAGAVKYAKSTLPLAIYMPTGDNDVFVMNVANCSGGSLASCTFPAPKWQYAGDGLGDAGQALVDLTFPEQALFSRNDCYKALSNPPSVGGTFTDMLPYPCFSPPPAYTFDNGGQGVGTYDLTQILTTPGELSSPAAYADYLAVKDFDPAHCSATAIDEVVRNTTNPPAGISWSDISPLDHFLSCDIRKVQAGGGHGAGLNVYVLTTNSGDAQFNNGRGPGQVYRGTTIQGGAVIGKWTPASGSGKTALGEADNFYVNPFNPSELYAVDVRDQAIKVSRDYGATWNVDSGLTDLATNLGEYVIGCNGSRGAGWQSDPFTNTCSVSWIGFDVFHPNIRVAAAGYGGILFSRDNGKDWIALDVTANNHFLSNELTKIVGGVFFDGETPLPGLGDGNQMIYAAMKGHSLIRADGPFLSLEALEFAYKPTVSPITSIVVNVSTLGQSIKLRKDADGVYRGQAIFDSKTYKILDYSLTVDGVLFTSQVYTLTATDIANGVAKPPL